MLGSFYYNLLLDAHSRPTQGTLVPLGEEIDLALDAPT